MYKALNGAIAVIGLAGAALTFAVPASADDVGIHIGDVGIGLNVGDVASGYQNGYRDQKHHWHQWRNDQEMRDYRNAHGSQYDDYRHDRDPDQGWHGK
jgi:hypothetical protein